ncbi:MAG TPA: methyltransferase domain-containing protein [Paracoccus sp.]|nr:methyltransferase domain-containing protein [Paracoccus sp. (in: a-proteobacteria)]
MTHLSASLPGALSSLSETAEDSGALVRSLATALAALDARDPAQQLDPDELAAFHRLHAALKNLSYGDRGKFGSAERFEFGWGAQTILFAADVLPYIHDVLLKHYRRQDLLEFLDVGCGGGAAANLMAQLHSSDVVFSRMNIHAIDHVAMREPWIRLNYPRVDFACRDLYEIEDRYDIVFCSHVIEHVPQVERFVARLAEVCRGFCFIYAPFEERDRIEGHVNTITRDVFAPFGDRVQTHVFRSMGWQPAKPETSCILAVIDCRADGQRHKPLRHGLHDAPQLAPARAAD